VSEPEPAQAAPETPEQSAGSTAAALKRRALLGGLALVTRTIITQFVVLGGQIVLARRLTPREFGAFAIVQFSLIFFTVFGDAGLGGALIQRKGQPTQHELSSVFWTQFGIGAVVIGLVSAVAGLLPSLFRDLPPESPWLLRLLALNFMATSMRVVPMILMERELQFVRLSAIDTVHWIVFYVTAAVLALGGAGIWSLAAGVLAQGATSLLLAYALRPWRPSLTFDRAAMRPLLQFGIPYQSKFVVGMALSAITPLWGGRVLGAQSVGLINWSQNTAYFPLRLVDIVGRVSFPLYSRLAGDPREFALAIERSVRITAFGTLFFVGLLLGIGPNITLIIYSAQWLPAVPLLYLYAIGMSVGFFTPVLATAFDALGDPKTVLRLSIVYTIGTWLTAAPASLLWGRLGFVIVYVAWVIIGNIAIIVLLRRKVPRARVVRQLRGPFAGGALTAAAGFFLAAPLVRGVPSLVLSIFALLAVFIVTAWLVDPAPLRDLITMLRNKKAEVRP
jgi:PST family polysaccharide transporter